MRLLIAATALMLVASLAACGDSPSGADEPPAEPVDVSITPAIPYMTGSLQYRGTTTLSADSSTVMGRFVPVGDGPWPVVVLLHGGTQRGSDMRSIAEEIARRGVIVYTPTYLHDLWDVDAAQIESGLWAGGTLLGDLSCAVRAARADAADHGGDPDRLIIVGYSMGGAFGATVALAGDDLESAGTSGSCVVSDGSAVPAAFVGWEGAYDWDAVLSAEFPHLLELAPDAVQALGPLGHIGASDSPLPFHLRSGDRLWKGQDNVEHMAEFEAALSAAGWPVTAEVLPGRRHTQFIDSPPMSEMIDLIIDVAYDPAGGS
jgi:dienelactone hydrolase